METRKETCIPSQSCENGGLHFSSTDAQSPAKKELHQWQLWAGEVGGQGEPSGLPLLKTNQEAWVIVKLFDKCDAWQLSKPMEGEALYEAGKSPLNDLNQGAKSHVNRI